MCMQNSVTIFLTVLQIGPFHFFRIWSSAKPRPIKNVSSQSLGLDLVNINVYAKVYQNIPLSSRDRAIFIFFRIWHSAKPRPMINVILQFLGLDLFNTKLSAKFYQNIRNGLIVNFHFFQILNLGKTSANPKCNLTISWATSCQYVYAKFHHNIPLSSRDRAIFTFSEFGTRQNIDPWKMTFHNLLD